MAENAASLFITGGGGGVCPRVVMRPLPVSQSPGGWAGAGEGATPDLLHPGSGLGTTFTGYKYLELGREQLLLLHTTLAPRPFLGTQSALAFREYSLASSVVNQSDNAGMLVDTVDKCCLVL